MIRYRDTAFSVVSHLFRALAHVIRHPPSEHADDIGLNQHYENIQTRLSFDGFCK